MSGNWVPLDDTSDQLLYEGSWSAINGSNRQWESGVHSTSEVGASCSLWFKGIGVHVRGTIPSGSDSQTFTYTIDDLPEVRVSNAQGSSNNYSVDFLRVEDLNEDIHRLTMTNAGPAPFQVDFLEYWPGENDPTPAPIYPPSSASGSQPLPSSTALSPGSEEPDSGRGLSTGAIAGISVGAAVLLIALSIALFIFLRRRKRGTKPKTDPHVDTSSAHPNQPPVTPFVAENRPSTTTESITSPATVATNPTSGLASPTTVVTSPVMRKSPRGIASEASLTISHLEPPPGYQEVVRESHA